ncbi:MAG TPA: HDOD domain-containing protein [Nitrospirales bacterium]|nr:HDOD domain-containing protein [Nitrospira sp. MA-1]HNP61295.1 HDOD domain-containing protein [Nitrospirales bacterium]
MDAQILQRIKNCKTLPAIPALPLQVLQLCRDERTTAQRIGDVISKDPSFVAKLLNVANSSFYGGSRHKVTTVTHAVTLLGMNSIATLAFCFSLYRDLRKKGGGAFDHTHFWHRCILASLASKVLAKRVRVTNEEEIFLAGLLQDLGVLVMSEALGMEYGLIYKKAAQDHQVLETLEQDRWKTDHCEIGAWLAETWELPELLRESVKGSHDPSLASSSDEVSRLTIQCVALSGRLADMWCHQQPEMAIQAAIQSSKELLDIEPEGLVEVAKQIADGIPDMSSFFQISLGNSDDIQKVLDNLEQIVTGISPSEMSEPIPAL